MRNILGRLATLPIAVKVLLVVAAPIVLAIAVLLSPLLVILAALVLALAVIALVIQLLRSGSLRRWGIVAAASLLLIVVCSGISNALYGGGGQSEQATSPEPTQEAEPAPSEPTKRAAEKDDEGDPAESQTRVKQEPAQEPERESPQPPSSEAKLADLGKVVAVWRVVDGDTIEVSPAVSGIADVRLIGIDTPETYGGTEPYGKEASAFTTQRLEGRKVALEFDVERIDPYGRVLAYVWLPDGRCSTRCW